MSRDDVRRDIEKLRTAKAGTPVPLEELMLDFEWFRPLPRARDGGSLSTAARKAAITRLLKSLYGKVQSAVLEDELTVAPERPTSFNMAEVIKHHKGALPTKSRGKGMTKNTSQEPRIKGGPWINYSLILDEKFTRFVGGDEAGGGLSASFGGSKATKGNRSKKKSNWAQLRDGVETLREIGHAEVVTFVALFDRLDNARGKPGPRTAKDGGRAKTS